jgi:hypothetical protein
MHEKKNTQRKPIIPESTIESEILWRLYKLGIFCWKNTSGGFFDGKRMRRQVNPFAIPGTSDILAIIKGLLIAIEVKSAKGKPTPEQIKFIDNVNKNGGIAFIARSWLEVETKLKELGLI